jgi:hypothetical protein
MIKKIASRRIRQGDVLTQKFVLMDSRGGERPQDVLALQRQISFLKRSLAQREHEVWTLKQLLLYR